METLFTNKKFIKLSSIFLVLLCLFTLAKFINEVNSGIYIGSGAPATSTITVMGTGNVTAVPDITTLSVTVSKDADTSAAAQSALNDSVTKVLAYLKSQKIADKDIKSDYGGVNPKYVYSQVVCVRYPCPQSDPKIVGYTAMQTITIKVRAVDSANDVRTGLANLGITDISGPTFTIDDEDNLKDAARANAIADAREKAQTLARSLGVRIVRVTSFSENGGGYPIMYDAKAMMAGSAPNAAPAPELPKGENKITSNVTITYEIR